MLACPPSSSWRGAAFFRAVLEPTAGKPAEDTGSQGPQRALPVLRTPTYPEGLPFLKEEFQRKIADQEAVLQASCSLLKAAMQMKAVGLLAFHPTQKRRAVSILRAAAVQDLLSQKNPPGEHAVRDFGFGLLQTKGDPPEEIVGTISNIESLQGELVCSSDGLLPDMRAKKDHRTLPNPAATTIARRVLKAVGRTHLRGGGTIRVPSAGPEWDAVERWRLLFVGTWVRDEHINILEARVLVNLARHLARSSSQQNLKTLVFTDSMVALGLFSKGRSSVKPLLRLARKMCVLRMFSGIKLLYRHIETLRNMADGPTRNQKIGEHPA